MNQEQDRASLAASSTAFSVILTISICHLINDMLQALLPAIYPILKDDFSLNFSQIGLITLTYQLTASILQPLIGLFADKRPTPLALPSGTLFTLAGLVTLAMAHSFPVLLAGAALLGMGSSIFHPEASRVAAMASGGRHGLAQSLFQVGGNGGQALGPLVAALAVSRFGQTSLAVIALLALLAAALLWPVSQWYREHGLARLKRRAADGAALTLPRGKAMQGLGLLLVLM
ncbi:MAG: MFS transporter, partial [Clostridia bacterium]|nr:MFS transporter [Clostridia bacterium]